MIAVDRGGCIESVRSIDFEIKPVQAGSAASCAPALSLTAGFPFRFRFVEVAGNEVGRDLISRDRGEGEQGWVGGTRIVSLTRNQLLPFSGRIFLATPRFRALQLIQGLHMLPHFKD